MFNSIDQFIPCIIPNKSRGDIGVFLPFSDKCLTFDGIQQKIDHFKSCICSLQGRLVASKTHRGGRFRAKKISIQTQIDYATKEIERFEKAKELIIRAMYSIGIEKLSRESKATQLPTPYFFTIHETVKARHRQFI